MAARPPLPSRCGPARRAALRWVDGCARCEPTRGQHPHAGIRMRDLGCAVHRVCIGCVRRVAQHHLRSSNTRLPARQPASPPKSTGCPAQSSPSTFPSAARPRSPAVSDSLSGSARLPKRGPCKKTQGCHLATLDTHNRLAFTVDMWRLFCRGGDRGLHTLVEPGTSQVGFGTFRAGPCGAACCRGPLMSAHTMVSISLTCHV